MRFFNHFRPHAGQVVARPWPDPTAESVRFGTVQASRSGHPERSQVETNVLEEEFVGRGNCGQRGFVLSAVFYLICIKSGWTNIHTVLFGTFAFMQPPKVMR